MPPNPIFTLQKNLDERRTRTGRRRRVSRAARSEIWRDQDGSDEQEDRAEEPRDGVPQGVRHGARRGGHRAGQGARGHRRRRPREEPVPVLRPLHARPHVQERRLLRRRFRRRRAYHRLWRRQGGGLELPGVQSRRLRVGDDGMGGVQPHQESQQGPLRHPPSRPAALLLHRPPRHGRLHGVRRVPRDRRAQGRREGVRLRRVGRRRAAGGAVRQAHGLLRRRERWLRRQGEAAQGEIRLRRRIQLQEGGGPERGAEAVLPGGDRHLLRERGRRDAGRRAAQHAGARPRRRLRDDLAVQPGPPRPHPQPDGRRHEAAPDRGVHRVRPLRQVQGVRGEGRAVRQGREDNVRGGRRGRAGERAGSAHRALFRPQRRQAGGRRRQGVAARCVVVRVTV